MRGSPSSRHRTAASRPSSPSCRPSSRSLHRPPAARCCCCCCVAVRCPRARTRSCSAFACLRLLPVRPSVCEVVFACAGACACRVSACVSARACARTFVSASVRSCAYRAMRAPAHGAHVHAQKHQSINGQACTAAKACAHEGTCGAKALYRP